MDFNHINIFDGCVIGIMVLSCLFAFFRGLVREILSLAAWIGAVVVTIHYFPMADAKLQKHFTNPMVAAGIATIGIYLAALVVFGLINLMIVKTIKSSGEAGMLDNLLGLVFGAFRGVLIISFCYFLITTAFPERELPVWIKDATTRPYAEMGASMLARVAPEYVHEISELQRKATDELDAADKKQAAPVVNGNAAMDAAGDNGGYSRQTTGQMNQLIDSTNQQPSR